MEKTINTTAIEINNNAAVLAERESALKELEYFVRVLILDQLEGRWEAEVGTTSTQIRLLDENNNRIFGHEFEIKYGYELSFSIEEGCQMEFQIKLNYGSMGSFDPIAEPSRFSLVMAIAKASKCLTNHATRNAFKDYVDIIKES